MVDLRKSLLHSSLALLIFLSGCEKRKDPVPDSITISAPFEFDSLDPHAKNTFSNLTILSHFYEPLVITDDNMRIRPCLASYWETHDPHTWLFHLRSGIKFHSGKLLNAEDVVYSFQRVQTYRELQMSGYVFSIQSVEALDPLTVRIRTASPISILLNKIRMILIVPKGTPESVFMNSENGTGPFRLLEWKKGEAVRMTRNDHYWGPKPGLRNVHFRLFRSNEDAAADIMGGQAKLAQSNSQRLKSLLANSKDWTLLRRDNIFMKYLSFDLHSDKTPYCDAAANPFKNKLVRQAINLAIDRKALIKKLPEYAVAANQPVPPFIFGHNPKLSSPRQNLEEARSLLRQAGFPDGFRVTLHARRIIGEAGFLVKDQLKRIGIHVDVQLLDDPDLLDRLTKGDFSFFLSRMGCPTGDASDILDNNFHSFDLERRYGLYNFGRYSNPELDLAIEKSSEITSVDRRRRALQEIMSTLMEDLVWIPLYFDQDIYALHKSFKWQPRSDSFILAADIHP